MTERSPWVWVGPMHEDDDDPIQSQQFVRKVSDGILSVLVSFATQLGWHMAVAFIGRNHNRYPTWEETLDAGEQLLPVGLIFVAAVQRHSDGTISSISVHQHDSPLDLLPPPWATDDEG